MKRIGWVGFVEDEPDFEGVSDGYVPLGGEPIQAVNVYKTRTEARKRYQDVRQVFIKEGDE